MHARMLECRSGWPRIREEELMADNDDIIIVGGTDLDHRTMELVREYRDAMAAVAGEGRAALVAHISSGSSASQIAEAVIAALADHPAKSGEVLLVDDHAIDRRLAAAEMVIEYRAESVPELRPYYEDERRRDWEDNKPRRMGRSRAARGGKRGRK